MRITLLMVSVLLSGLAFGQFCSEDMKSIYRRWDAAYQRKDVSRLARLMHPRMRLVFEGGETRDREEYLLSLDGSDRPAFYKTTVLKVRSDRWNRVVYTHEVSDDGDGHRHGHRYKDTWARHRGQWKLIESVTLWHG